MTKELIKWQLPVKTTFASPYDWVHHWARPHAYIYCNNTDKSLCGKHTFDESSECVNTNEKSHFYEKPNKEHFCNKCLKKLEKLGVKYD